MAEVLKKQRKSNFSPDEVDVLVRTVGKNYETLYGEFSKRAINKNARHIAWIDVTKEVNQVSLEKRTLQEVKNKWKKCQHLYRAEDFVGVSEELVNPDDTNVWEPLTSIEDEGFPLQRKFLKKSAVPSVFRCTSKKTSNSISPRMVRSEKRNAKRDLKPPSTVTSEMFEDKENEIPLSDSMPLEQRLKTPTAEQEAILQSQPLSPTKLKVTRQTKPAQSSPKSPTPPPIEEVCLKWNSHHSNMQNTFPNLLLREQYVDATLVAEGQTLKCHRVILSSCSPYFEEILASISPNQHPVLFMKDVPFWILKSLCDFMYSGEVHILQTKLEELLAIAEILKIKGLAGTTDNAGQEIKTELGKPIKEEKKDENKLLEEDPKKKEVKEPRKKDDKDGKKKEEMKDSKDKKRPVPAPPPEMPILKSAKISKVSSHTEMPILQSTKSSKNSNCSRRAVRKFDKVERITRKPNSDFLDPLDLLEPVYEELTKEPIQTTAPLKPKETKPIPMRRSLPKKLKKRKLTDEREESPPPVLSRKGTRSRPNRKVPKFYHTNYEQSTIVREPHTVLADPLMHLHEIKAEPLDLEDNAIEIEDNLVNFSENDITLEDEEIMGDYDSPIVNFHTEEKQTESPAQFKKIGLLSQPIILNVESVAEKSEDTIKLTNLAAVGGREGEKGIDPLEDPLNFSQISSDINITGVQNVLESNENSLGFHISEVVTEKEDSTSTETCRELGFQITNVVSEEEKPDKQASDIIRETKEGEEKAVAEKRKERIIIDRFELEPNIEKKSSAAETGYEVFMERDRTCQLTSTTLKMTETNSLDVERNLENEKVYFDREFNETSELQRKTEDKFLKSVNLKTIVANNPSEFSQNDDNNMKDTIQKMNENYVENEDVTNRGQSESYQDGNISNTMEKLQLHEESNNSKCPKDMMQSEENTDSFEIGYAIMKNLEKPIDKPHIHDEVSKSTLFIKETHSNNFSEPEGQVLHGDDQNSNPSSIECAPTHINRPSAKFDSSAILTAIGFEAASSSPCHNKNDPSITEFQYSSEAKFSRDGFLLEDYNQDSVSPSTVGFHIAQVVSEQIAQNEESKFTDQCGKDVNSPCEDDERYISNSNELETIVNDLTKIVGETCEDTNSRINEDSSVIAESLENLLQD